MKIYVIAQKIAISALLTAAINNACADSQPATQASPTSSSWYTPSWAANPVASYVVKKTAEGFQAASPYVKSGAQKIGYAANAIDSGTRGVAREAFSFIAENQWPAMIETLARIKGTLYRLNNSVANLTALFDTLSKTLPDRKLNEIDRIAGIEATE